MSMMFRSMIKGLLPMMPEALEKIESQLTGQLASVELRAGESRAAYLILTGQDRRIYIAECVLDQDDKIVRSTKHLPAKEFLQSIIDTL